MRFELEIVVPFSLYLLPSLLPQLFPAHIISNSILVLQTQFSLPFIINICKARIKIQMLIVIIQVKWIMEATVSYSFSTDTLHFCINQWDNYALPQKFVLSHFFWQCAAHPVNPGSQEYVSSLRKIIMQTGLTLDYYVGVSSNWWEGRKAGCVCHLEEKGVTWHQTSTDTHEHEFSIARPCSIQEKPEFWTWKFSIFKCLKKTIAQTYQTHLRAGSSLWTSML